MGQPILYCGVLLTFFVGRAVAAPTGEVTADPQAKASAQAGNSQTEAPKAEKRLLKPADFKYVGSFAPPLHPTGDWKEGQTAYAAAGLAMRKVKGEIHFFHAAQPDGQLLYEMVLPEPAVSDTTAQKWPRAKVVKTWRDWNKKTVISGNTQVILMGLYWDEARDGLWWNYANSYNVSGKNDPSFGFTQLKDSGPVIEGPWRAEGDMANSHRTQGGITRIPDWFASKYTAGKTLGIGFGGAAAGSQNSSYGPALFALDPPKEGTPAVKCQALLNYPAPDHFCIRDANYKTEVKWSKNPAKGVGFWTTADHLTGGAIWIDLPDAHGLVYFPQLAHGTVAYKTGGTRWEGAGSHIYIYDPADLARVARKQMRPWDVKPAHMALFPFLGYEDGPYAPGQGDGAHAVNARGCCLDLETRTLYVLVSQSYKTQGSWFPLVHAFKIK
jgi:hypothetical protein